MPPVFSYTDKLYGKTHRYTPARGEIVIAYKHHGITPPSTIPASNPPKRMSDFLKEMLDTIPALKSVKDSTVAKVGDYVAESSKAMKDDPSITKERVPIIGSKLGVGFALVMSSPADHDNAMTLLGNVGDIYGRLEAMKDELNYMRYFVPGYFTLQLDETLSSSNTASDNKIKELDYKVMSKEPTGGYYVLEVPTGKTLFDTLAESNSKQGVKFAEPFEFGFDDSQTYVEIDSRDFTPPDPDWPNNTTGLTKIKALEAWNVNASTVRGRADVIIVTVDSGAQMNHVDLSGNILTRPSGEDWDFTSSGLIPNDTNGQGTAVGGIGAAQSNTAGALGLANLCKLMPLKINLSGASPYTDRYNAIMLIGANTTGKAVVNASTTRYVMNLSWKMSSDVTSIHTAITTAYNNNVLIVACAGNTRQNIATSPKYPACYSEVIMVGATNGSDARWQDTTKSVGTEGAGSNYGTRASDGTMVLGCPGVSLRTSKYDSLVNNTFEYRTGTGASCSLVSALGALIWSLNKDKCGSFTWGKGTVRTIITNTANCDSISTIDDNNGKINYRVNAEKALIDANNRAC